MQWITSAGGPLLLVCEARLDQWGGCITSTLARESEVGKYSDFKGTDYDRACQVTGYLGLVDVDAGHGLVLADDPMPTTWVPFGSSRGGLLVRWMFADREAEILGWIGKIPESEFQQTRVVYGVDTPRLVLFDAATPGSSLTKKSLDERLLIEIEIGSYHVETAIFQPDERTGIVVHRLSFPGQDGQEKVSQEKSSGLNGINLGHNP